MSFQTVYTQGIIGHHAYSVLDCREIEAGFLLGHQTSMTAFLSSSSSSSSSSSVQEVVDLDADEDGSISIEKLITPKNGVEEAFVDLEFKRKHDEILTESGSLRVLRSGLL